MSYKENNGRSIEDAFIEFHKMNPKVYEQIILQALKAKKAGKEKFSVKAIINFLRWEIRVQVKKAEGPSLFNDPNTYTENFEQREWKLNDAFSSLYARMLIKDYPILTKYIEIRKLRAEK